MHTREENSKKRKHTFWDDLPELVKLDKEDCQALDINSDLPSVEDQPPLIVSDHPPQEFKIPKETTDIPANSDLKTPATSHENFSLEDKVLAASVRAPAVYLSQVIERLANIQKLFEIRTSAEFYQQHDFKTETRPKKKRKITEETESQQNFAFGALAVEISAEIGLLKNINNNLSTSSNNSFTSNPAFKRPFKNHVMFSCEEEQPATIFLNQAINRLESMQQIFLARAQGNHEITTYNEIDQKFDELYITFQDKLPHASIAAANKLVNKSTKKKALEQEYLQKQVDYGVFAAAIAETVRELKNINPADLASRENLSDSMNSNRLFSSSLPAPSVDANTDETNKIIVTLNL